MNNYWLVGSNWVGNNQDEVFCRRGYWELGYRREEQPAMAALRDQMKAEDRIAIVQDLPSGASAMQVKAIGIIKEFENDNVYDRVYIDWLLTNINRNVYNISHPNSISGPYTASDDSVLLGQVFRI